MQNSRFLQLLHIAGSLSAAATAYGQDVRLHGVGAVAHAIGGHQQRELGWGGTVRVAGEWVVLRELGLLLQGSETYLSAGGAPKQAGLARLDAALGLGANLGVRYRPFARRPCGKTACASGLWLTGAGGVSRTGRETRPMVDVALGFDFLLAKSQWGMGPTLGLEHVFQRNDEVRPADANMLFFGIHAMLDGAKLEEVDGDMDGDGVLDSVDSCPIEREDRDGFADADGCPEPDNDGDQIVDRKDGCPLLTEDGDGFEDADGCPEPDNDRDRLIDVRDKCPNEAEDRDGFEDSDGCPEFDNDHDGIPDGKDLCPKEPETRNGYADEDGCPDAAQIRVVGDKIVLDERVHFMINSHIIRRESFGLLTRLAELIREHPEYVHVEVQGHTDERGDSAFNERLSQVRADAVMAFLVKRGIGAERLSAKGYGQSRPLIAKQTEYAYYMNRRVEFEITREIKEAP